MFNIEHFVIAIVSIAFPPFMLLVLALILFSSFGWTLGIREQYVFLLLKIFEWGRQKIEMEADKCGDDEAELLESPAGRQCIEKEVVAPASITDKQVPFDREPTPLASDSDNNSTVDDSDMLTTDDRPVERGKTVENSLADYYVDKQPLNNNFTTPNGKKKTRTNSVNEKARNKLSEHQVIQKKTFCEAPTNITISSMLEQRESDGQAGNFQPGDIADYVRWGMEAITEDEVTKRFSTAELSSWNLLTRTNQQYHFLSIRLSFLWFVGFFFRYMVLMPIRIMIAVIGVVWLIISTAFVGYLPGGEYKRRTNRYINLMCFRIIARSFSAIVKFHDPENRPRENAICVANHTSPIDAVLLAADNCYEFIGQRHGGFFGLIQRALSRGSEHIWFERSEMKDREAVSRKLKAHINSPHALPILIFPEGTCINNTSVMMFKKGSFELDCDVYPVAIKYDQRFGDAFWDSSKHSLLVYMYRIMTSWALVADVMYLPPMRMKPDEDSVAFANRVKKEIARRGGFVDLDWDGGLKRSTPKAEWKEVQRKYFSERLKSQQP